MDSDFFKELYARQDKKLMDIEKAQEVAKNFVHDMVGDVSLMDVSEYLDNRGYNEWTMNDIQLLADTINTAKIIVKFGR